jgi:phenylacetate-CoA ligase
MADAHDLRPESQRQLAPGLDLSVVVPCFNEELNIPELVQRVLGMFETSGLRGELVLVDDGSADGTSRVIRERSRKDARVVGVFHRVNRGMAGAWRTGVNAARGTYVAIIDADLQYQPEDILRLYRNLLDSSVDIVQGWRSSVGRERGARYTLSRGFNTVLNGAFGMSLRDNKSGFVCCAREVIQDLLTYQGRYAYWQSFIMVAAHAKGYTYKEIEAVFEDRKQGTSFLEGRALSAAARCLVDVGTALWEYRVRTEPHDLARNFLKKEGAELDEPPSLRANPTRFHAYTVTLGRTHGVRARSAESYYETLSGTQWLSPEQLRELQDEKLRRLVRHAYRSVPYYRVRMQQSRLHPEDIRTQEDLVKLPKLTRADVRKHLYFDIMQEGVSQGDLLKLTMSGQPGEPFLAFADRAAVEFRWAASMRFRDWTGYRFGQPSARFWGEGIGLNGAHAAKQQADARFANRLLLSAFRLDERSVAASIRAIRKHRAVLIEGPTESLEIVAAQLKRQGGLDYRPKAVLVHGQSLTATRRASIEEAFGCRVMDLYRSGEFNDIACETEQRDGLLVAAEGYIVEVLVDGHRAANYGEEGELFVTDLNNRCMPFIRYATGDRAISMGPDAGEPHARGLPRIGRVAGRAGAVFEGENGARVPSGFFSALFAEYGYAVRRFSVADLGVSSIALSVEKAPRYSESTLEAIKRRIRERLGASLAIEVSFEEPQEAPVSVRAAPSSLASVRSI